MTVRREDLYSKNERKKAIRMNELKKIRKPI
jgi:hypothetical protein